MSLTWPKIDPSAESTLVGKGVLYFALGDTDRALKAFTAALEYGCFCVFFLIR